MTESTTIHPNATVDPTAVIGEGVVIEADAYVGPHCVIGDGSRLRLRSVVIERTTLGAGCDVHPYAVLGGDAQDFKYNPDVPGRLIIGDGCTFREGVTIHRSVGDEEPTIIGNQCYFMANSHAGHNTVVGNNVTLANGTLLAGHVRINDRCVFGGNSAVHQFCEVGEGVMIQGGSIVTMHVLPFTITNEVNSLSGVNIVGLRRAEGVTREDIAQVREVYRTLFRERRPLGTALESLGRKPWGPYAQRMIDFAQTMRSASPPKARGLASPDV